MASYKQRVDTLKRVQLVLIVICIIAIIGFAFWINKPTITGYAIVDECGPIGGRISHLIDNEDACKNACRAQCLSLDKEYESHDFTENPGVCHECECKCKE